MKKAKIVRVMISEFFLKCAALWLRQIMMLAW